MLLNLNIVSLNIVSLEYEERFLMYFSYTVIDNHNMSEEIRVSIDIIKISNVNMYILCDLKGQYLNHDHSAHVYEYMGGECSRQRMQAIFTLSRTEIM